MEDHTQDMLALWGKLGVEKLVFMSHSTSGPIAAKLADELGNLCKGLVVLASCLGFDATIQVASGVLLQKFANEPWFSEAMEAFKTSFTFDKPFKTEDELKQFMHKYWKVFLRFALRRSRRTLGGC
eukprot:gb/GECG01009706.1/.p1 GENE.gb/GECG01009706.1/~~gb/GECG01009706.1/.p1  ORF type:complete len:126 (+),score=12.75 gb/GECG01009706.1/:1-378(+)